MLNCDRDAAVTALPVAVAGALPLEELGEFRVASGAVVPNMGKIKMKSTDESGVARSIRGHITEIAKPLLSAAENSRIWDSLLFKDGGILLERNFTVSLEVRAILKNHRVWDCHGKSIRLYREENLHNAFVRTGHVTPESLRRSSQPRRAGPDLEKWTWTMEIMMSRTKQNNLRNSGKFQLHANTQSWRGRNIFRQIVLCLHRGAKCV